MTPEKWASLKVLCDLWKYWGRKEHRKKQYAKRNALFARHDEATLKLYQEGKA